MSPQLKELSPQIDILNKIKNGELFTKDEIKEITEMLKRSSEQIKDKKIRVIFENILDVLGTIEKDQVLTTQEKHIIDENIGKIIGKKQDGELFKEIIEMLKNLGGQIEDKKIRVVFKNILDVLMTIEKDQVLEKAVIDKKNKISLSYFTPRRGRSRSRSRRADDASASARGPPLRPRSPLRPLSTLDTIIMILGFYLSIWLLYLVVWKIEPATLDFSGFMRTHVGAILTCALIIWATK